jgi:PAS domain-containing protein
LGARNELKVLGTLLDTISQPVWLRHADGRLAWANKAFLAAVEARSLDEARARGLEILDRGAREESARKRQQGERFTARIAAVVGGSRRVLDVMEGPTVGGSSGIAVDVSEFDGVRNDLQRQMDAHIRTLDQLPTAVAMFDSKQRLVFHNAAYRQLWDLDQGFLDQKPLDGEVLDRLRAARKLPEQAISGAGRRRCSPPTAPPSRSRPGGTSPTAAPCGSSPTRAHRAVSPICSTTSATRSISNRATTR